MVVPTTTEYTRSYKTKVFARAGKIYDDNLEFRLQKREMEQNHTTSPFMWDPSETDSSDRSNGSGEQERPKSVPPHKYKHEKFNRSYQKKLLQQQQMEEDDEEEESSPERRGRSRERRERQGRSQSRSQSRGRCSGESVPRHSKPARHAPAQTNGVHVLRDQGVQTPDWARMKGHKTMYPSASFESRSSGICCFTVFCWLANPL